jgi:hypothetical protein
MSQFWIGYFAAIGTYLVIGLGIGIAIVWTHLAYFFAGGWQFKRMALTIAINIIAWPTAILELIPSRT